MQVSTDLNDASVDCSLQAINKCDEINDFTNFRNRKCTTMENLKT